MAKVKVEEKAIPNITDPVRTKEFTDKIQKLCQEYKLDIRIGIFPLQEDEGKSQVHPAQGDTNK